MKSFLKSSKGWGVLLSSAILFSLVGCSSTPDAMEGMGEVSYTRYTRQEESYQLEFPSNWDARENVMQMSVIALSPKDSGSDPFQENISVATRTIVRKPGTPLDMDQVIQILLAKTGTMFQNVKLLKRGEKLCAGEQAPYIIFSGTDGRLDYRWMQVFVLKKDRIFILTYTSDARSHKKYLPAMEHAIQSFKVL